MFIFKHFIRALIDIKKHLCTGKDVELLLAEPAVFLELIV